ncbi:hypothetical protein SAMN05892883_0363 [Jatrophihabitans sp. GAS493]|uniref:hypothetical protein n=1 Tax=Jatrophihabitans sp. GAS493 TaxID=1907575 RepID=UPI000BB6F7C5|nr:hypothetical protein [Jatrophihabitans sp. GAS493]SOD70704.1 hypothetical protein SAMN05892883_0363 [Jatrophihabitans sp. GAS493]
MSDDVGQLPRKASHRRALANAMTNVRCPTCHHARMDAVSETVALCGCGAQADLSVRYETKKTTSGVRVLARIESATARR